MTSDAYRPVDQLRPQRKAGSVSHHDGQADRMAFVERPFREAQAALHSRSGTLGPGVTDLKPRLTMMAGGPRASRHGRSEVRRVAERQHSHPRTPTGMAAVGFPQRHQACG
jgi:hypothetical protein